MLSILRFTVILWLCLPMLSGATAPQRISYQGRLTDVSGNPVPDNPGLSVTFKIYSVQAGGIALWTETQSVSVKAGLFSVPLGSYTPLPTTVFADSSRWLGITVSGTELSPRARLLSVPYSHRVSTIDGTSGGVVSGVSTFQDASGSDWMVVGGDAENGRVGLYQGAQQTVLLAGKYSTNSPHGGILISRANGDPAISLEGSIGGGLTVWGEESERPIRLVANYNSTGIGRVVTPVLEITGGSDLAEHFDINSPDGGSSILPGTVVCIDPQDPGKLVVSTRQYDATVAGVISGGGNVSPGMLMGQRGTLAQGQYPIALSGRVYCLADATYGAISPGDLLTTSNTPGHVMKVSDRTQSYGTVVGKAMSSLQSGRGLVLVLVSLQ